MGKRFRFIHCADLHLGAPFADLAGGEEVWAKSLRQATFEAFAKIVDLAVEEHVAAIIIAGDVYNSADHSLAAQLGFARELYRAAKAGIKTYIVHGNHDSVDAWRAQVPLPPGVYVFGSESVTSLPLIVDGEEVAVIYGRSYGSRHVKENWVKDFQKKSNDPYAIGILHTDGPEGVSEDYVPCDMDDLLEARMDYWALGHVHTRNVLKEQPHIVYPGSPQGLHRLETGARGCYLVEVGSYGTTMIDFRETDAVRWLDWKFNIEGLEQIGDLVHKIGERRLKLREELNIPALIRLQFCGRGSLRQVLRDSETQEWLLRELNEKELFKRAYAYFYRIDDETQSEIDWMERRLLPDVAGDYLRVFDRWNSLPASELDLKLREILTNRPEISRLGVFGRELSDERLRRAFRNTEITGAEILLGDEEL